MGALLAKEFRTQRPFVFLILFLLSTSYFSAAITRPFTLMSTEKLYGEGLIEMGMDYAVVSFLLSIAISYGLLIREFDDRTIEFLDALPVSRTQLFFAKWVAAICTLMLIPILDLLFVIPIRAISTTSLDRSYHFDWIATSVVLQFVQLFCFLSIGMALSFLRRFGLLFLAVLTWALMILGRFVPVLTPSNLTLFGEASFDGKTWLIPWQLVSGYLIVGLMALLLAYGLFMGGGRAVLRILSGSESRLRQAVLLCSSAAIVFVVLGMVTQIAIQDPRGEQDPDAVRVRYPGWARSSRSTAHYDVMFPNNLANRANGLLDEADETYRKVAEFLQYDQGTRIAVDMTSYSGHHLGTAYWNKLKMDLTAHEDLPALRQTLGHETTHVILESLSENNLRKNFESVRFFHEGVATYVERRFFTDIELAEQRIRAAMLQEREETSFDRLVDNDKLRAEHDSLLAYELGEVFAAAIVGRCGEDAIGILARTFADTRHSEGLDGVVLWRSVFQAAGYSLNETVDEYYKLLDEAKKLHQDTIAKLLELRPIVEFEEDSIWIQTEQEPPEGWQIVVRFRASVESPDDEYWTEPVEDGSCDARLRSFVGRAAWYQIGYRQKGEFAIFQPWQKIRLR